MIKVTPEARAASRMSSKHPSSFSMPPLGLGARRAELRLLRGNSRVSGENV